MFSVRVGAWPRLGKVCFRRLSRLSTRHIAVERAPRAPLSFGNRTYHNPSFSARPNNTLAAKIWYRKNGVPRSKWKGVLFVFVAWFAYATSQELSAFADEQILLSLILLTSDVDTSSVDLSTPRGAITHFRDLLCAGSDRLKLPTNTGKIIARGYDVFLKFLDSGRFSPDKVEEFHRIAKEACEAVHKTLALELRGLHQGAIVKRAIALRMNMLIDQFQIFVLVYGLLDTKQAQAMVDAWKIKDEKSQNGGYDTVD